MKSHAAKVPDGDPKTERERVGNGLADAAAKLALLYHELPPDAIDKAAAAWLTSTTTISYLARITAAVIKANDDVDEKYRRKHKRIDNQTDVLTLVKDAKHMAIRMPNGVVCLWCNRRAITDKQLEVHKCTACSQHSLWKSGNIITCSRCGAYSQQRAHGLKQRCEPANDQARYRIRRFFVKRIHPARNVPLDDPISFWHDTTREADQNAPPPQIPTSCETAELWDEKRWASVLNIGKTHYMWIQPDFSVPKPDEPAFLDAVRGSLAVSACDDAPQIAAQPAAVSADDPGDSRINRPAEALAPLITSGATIRGRFKIHSEAIGYDHEHGYSSDLPRPNEMGEPSRYSAIYDPGCSGDGCRVCNMAMQAALWARDALDASGGECAQGTYDHDARVINRVLAKLCQHEPQVPERIPSSAHTPNQRSEGQHRSFVSKTNDLALSILNHLYSRGPSCPDFAEGFRLAAAALEIPIDQPLPESGTLGYPSDPNNGDPHEQAGNTSGPDGSVAKMAGSREPKCQNGPQIAVPVKMQTQVLPEQHISTNLDWSCVPHSAEPAAVTPALVQEGGSSSSVTSEKDRAAAIAQLHIDEDGHLLLGDQPQQAATTDLPSEKVSDSPPDDTSPADECSRSDSDVSMPIVSQLSDEPVDTASAAAVPSRKRNQGPRPTAAERMEALRRRIRSSQIEDGSAGVKPDSWSPAGEATTAVYACDRTTNGPLGGAHVTVAAHWPKDQSAADATSAEPAAGLRPSLKVRVRVSGKGSKERLYRTSSGAP